MRERNGVPLGVCLVLVCFLLFLPTAWYGPSQVLSMSGRAGPLAGSVLRQPLIASPVDCDTRPQFSPLDSSACGPESVAPGPEDRVRVIILLEGDSVSTYKRRVRSSADGLTAASQECVRAYDLTLRNGHERLLQQMDAEGITLQVRRRYRYLLNGLAGSTRMRDVERIAMMAGVRGVYRDYEVCGALTHSVPLIGADQVWTMLDPSGQPATGEGMRVAVIDTGIDYNHPDLGGGFGPGYKVVDGYDFVNEDADPMDDSGHGTHVAGIVAASGTLRGVAPGASLYAYKALDASGHGCSCDVIASIERATDPDGDPVTDDAVDVINLSLRADGNPDDPMSLAVDAAVEQGVMAVVAEGNTN